MTERDSPRPDADRHHTLNRERATFIIGLSLALSAFSLSDASVQTAGDVAQAVGFFAIAFFFVITIWGSIAWLFDYYPPDVQRFYRGVLAILFLTSLAPFFLSLLLSHSLSVQQLGAVLLAGDLAAVELIVTTLRLHLVRSYGAQLPDPVRHEAWQLLVLNGVVAAFFLCSLLVLLLPGQRIWVSYFWGSAFVIPRLVVRLPAVKRRLRREAEAGAMHALSDAEEG